MDREQLFSKRLDDIKREIGKASLVAVSKYYPVEDIVLAYNAGQRIFGESRVQELRDKSLAFERMGKTDVEWHFIGHLQSNKINNLFKISSLKCLHAVDSLDLLAAMYQKEQNIAGDSLAFFLQYNTSGENEKHGIDSLPALKECLDFIVQSKQCKLSFCGLMTMGRIRTNNFVNDARDCFGQLRNIREQILKEYPFVNLQLSMGMSGDYKIAVQEGADFVRIGSAIFEDCS